MHDAPPAVEEKMRLVAVQARKMAYALDWGHLADEAESAAVFVLGELTDEPDFQVIRFAVRRAVRRVIWQFRIQTLGRWSEFVPDRPERVGADPNQLKWLRGCIERLPPRRRRAMRLRLGIGRARPHSVQEISVVMKIHQTTVSKTIGEAIKEIDRMAREPGGPKHPHTPKPGDDEMPVPYEPIMVG